MKKKNIIIIIVAIVVILALVIGGFFIYKAIKNSSEDYQIAEVKEYNYFLLNQDDKFGVIDKTGNIIVQPQYEEVTIPNPEKAVFICSNDGNTQVYNEKNEQIMTEYSDVEAIRLKNVASNLMYEKSVLKYSEDGKYGLIDFTGKKITKPIYDELDSLPYKEGQFLVGQDGKYGVINLKGNNIVDIQYEQVDVDGYYSEENGYKYAGYIVSVKTDEGYRYGYLDCNGNEVLDTVYNDLSRVKEIGDNSTAYLVCAQNGQYGVNKNSENIIKNEYQSISYDENNNVFIVERTKKYGVDDVNGKEIIPVEYTQIDSTGNYLYAQDDQGTTVYDSTGNQADIDANISILSTTNSNYRIKIDNSDVTKYGVIDSAGNNIIPENYNYISYLDNNYFIASNDQGKLGVIDDAGNTKVELKYDLLQKIDNTDLLQASTSTDNVTQIYSKDLALLCEMTNATIEQIGDYIKVYNDTESRYFNKQGNEVTNKEVYPNNKLYTTVENGKWGFVDTAGNIVVDCKYDKATEFNEYGFAAVKLDGKWGAINSEGQEVVEPKYEINTETEPSFIGIYYKVVYGYGECYYTT